MATSKTRKRSFAAAGRRPVMGAFNQGGVPTIVCVNKAKTPLGVDFGKLVEALQAAVDRNFAPVWGTPCVLKVAASIPAGAWGLVFVDDPDVADALGYHDLTPAGLPLGFVFVRTTLDARELVSVTASHELFEMLVDPGIQMWAEGPKGVLWAYETADAVEATALPVNGIPLSNFVYPSFFEGFRKPGSVPFDWGRQAKAPFKLLRGGYSIVHNGGKVSQIFGSLAKEKRFAKEDRRMHRSHYREQRVLKALKGKAA